MQNEDGTFRNILSYNRGFEEEQNLDDAFGRAVWSLGYIIRFAPNYFEVAEKTRNFLEKHCFVNNYLNVIGNKRWLKPDDYSNEFDQQPVDAMAMVLMYNSAQKS